MLAELEPFTPRCDPAEVLFKWRERGSVLSPELATARLVRDITKSEVAFPLPMSADVNERMSTANFFLIGLEATVQRHVSTTPNLWSPPVEPGKRRSEKRSDDRRQWGLAMWEENLMPLQDEQRAWEFYTYARAPVMVRPEYRMVDGKRVGMPVWEPMDGLSALPAPSTSAADVHPDDCVFEGQMSWRSLLRNYPEKAALLYVGANKPSLDAMFDLVRYVDDEQDTLIVVGRDPNAFPMRGRKSLQGVYSGRGNRIVSSGDIAGHYGAHEAVVLRSARNLAGAPLVIMPGRWGLDGRNGMMDGLVGLMFRVQRLSALEDDAIERGVFPEEWLVNPSGNAKVVTKADGRRGILGEVTEGTIVTRDLQPGYRTTQAIDRMMGYLQQEGHIASEMIGENPTGVRTGVRGDALQSAFVSFNLASGHRVFEAAKARELEVAALVDREYFGSKPKRFFVAWAGGRGRLDYTPKDLFTESTRFVVEYPMVGADSNIQQQADMAKVGNRTMSRETAMERDQAIKDVPKEKSKIDAERIKEAVMTYIETQAANPQAPFGPDDFGRLSEIVLESGEEPYRALRKVHAEAQERQAKAQELEAGDPALQPGVGPGDVSAPAGPPSLEQLLAQATAGGAPAAA